MRWPDLNGMLRHQLKGVYDYFRAPEMQNTWGGAFNGQAGRLRLFEALCGVFEFENAVETGSFKGDTIGVLAENVAGQVISIDLAWRNIGFVRARYRGQKNVLARQGDSREELARLLRDPRFRRGNQFFYLDAHWEEDLPLAEELEIICSSKIPAVIMVDDFRVPDDAGYAFDDYGPGKRLEESYLRPGIDEWNLGVFYPSLASADETGARRGCVVLTVPALTDKASGMPQLREVKRADG